MKEVIMIMDLPPYRWGRSISISTIGIPSLLPEKGSYCSTKWGIYFWVYATAWMFIQPIFPGL
jgi:hypothetical protein